MSGLVKNYGKHHVSTDGGTWYPQAYNFLNLGHHAHSYLEKNLIERGRYSILRTEPKVLMIIFLAEKKTAN